MPVLTTDVSLAMANYYNMHDKQQFARSQRTLKYLFNVRKEMMKGEEWHYKAWTQPVTTARMVNAETAEESEFPTPRKLAHVDIHAHWSDLAEFRTSIAYTGLVQEKTANRQMALYQTAAKYVSEVEDDIGSQVNMTMHQNADSMMGRVCALNTFPVSGGTTGMDTTSDWSSGPGYIKVDGGSISQFFEGQILAIRAASDNTTIRLLVTVNAVLRGNEGPAGIRGDGPGIIVTKLSGTYALSDVVDNDEICMDVHTTNYLLGFGSWFSRSAAVLSITAGVRASTAGVWTWPVMKDFTSDGVSVTFDLDIHMREVAEELAYAVAYGRKQRGFEGVKITEAAMTCLTTPRLISEVSTQVGDNVRYTTTLSAAERGELFGTSGYDGAYWHHPLLGPISFATDPVATPDTLRLLEPSSWFFLTGSDGIEWLDADGSKWHYQQGTYALKNILIAGALQRMLIANDQPGVNVQVSGIKSSTE